MPFHNFRHWIAVLKNSCNISQQKWKQAGWAPQIHNQYVWSRSSLYMKSVFNSLYTTTKSQKLKATPNVDLAMNLLLSKQARKHGGESAYHQFKTMNLRQHHAHQ